MMNSPYFEPDEDEAACSHEPAAPGWVITYADLMSLLLTFFILLASMSELKSEHRVSQAVESLQKHFGPDEAGVAWAGLGNRRYGNVRDDGLGAPPTIANIRADRTAPIGERIYFDEASTTIDEAQRAKLRQIQEQFQGKLQRIEVRGHTTRRPLPAGSPYRDHWDLAFARARAVADELTAQGIDPRRIRLGVSAGNEPTSPGNDPLILRENSRVELFLLNEFNDGREGSDSDAARPTPPR